MKFTEAWANIAKENLNLKVALGALTICTLFLGFSLVRLSLKAPLIIERGCFSSSVSVASDKPTVDETKVFIEKALKQRFNSNTSTIEGFLSTEEEKLKLNEQKELSKKEITQFIILRDIQFENDSIVVDVDRLYSVQNVRSTFPIQLKLTLESKSRTETNPYGLILVRTEEIKKGKTNNEG